MCQRYEFKNRPLPYAYDALEPYIDEKTMRLHHDKHLQTYIDNLNRILSDYPSYQNWTLEQILYNIPSLPEAIQTSVKNNAGGVFNHQFFFSCLTSQPSSDPGGMVYEEILRQFGSYDQFKKEFKDAALSVFGSGYAWMVINANGKLDLTTTANQDTTLPLFLYPLLNLDVWEHAYYLKHYNKRADYIDDWFSVINWEYVNQNYCCYHQIFFEKDLAR